MRVRKGWIALAVACLGIIASALTSRVSFYVAFGEEHTRTIMAAEVLTTLITPTLLYLTRSPTPDFDEVATRRARLVEALSLTGAILTCALMGYGAIHAFLNLHPELWWLVINCTVISTLFCLGYVFFRHPIGLAAAGIALVATILVHIWDKTWAPYTPLLFPNRTEVTWTWPLILTLLILLCLWKQQRPSWVARLH